MLKSVLSDLRQLKLELQRLDDFVTNKSGETPEGAEAHSDLIERVKALLELKDLRELAETCQPLR